MKIENITNPGEEPQGGDKVKITHDKGGIEIKNWVHDPPPDPEPIPQAKFTSLAFMDLVGDTNMVTLLTLAKTDPIAELLVKKIDRALVIDFDDEARGPKAGLLYLLSQGHLSQAEYDRIMSREFPTS